MSLKAKKMLLFNRDKLQFFPLQANTLSELSGTSQEVQKILYFLDTTPKTNLDTYQKGLWANDSVAIVSEDTPMYKLTGLPSHWYSYSNTLFQIILSEAVEIS